ncbi:MAG: hypothetical protein LJF30_24485 [Acidobacteria bacterium]|jgi:regulator of protease activity HflC (stomatin/prohibitin superfamily)|nr:hypothetical protein [Acidobacteriota bacterium]
MPVLIVLLTVLLNRPSVVGEYGNPVVLNLGLAVTLLLALLVSYSGALGPVDGIREILASSAT